MSLFHDKPKPKRKLTLAQKSILRKIKAVSEEGMHYAVLREEESLAETMELMGFISLVNYFHGDSTMVAQITEFGAEYLDRKRKKA